MQMIRAEDIATGHHPVSLVELWKHKTDRIFMLSGWLLLTAISVGLGLATVIYQWSGLPMNFGGADVYLTIYPPLTICTLLVLLFGFWWGAIPAYLSTLVLALYVGMDPQWALIFACANPLGFTVFAIVYRTLPVSLSLRTPHSILFFVLLAFLSSILGATGSFIWTHTHPVGAYQSFAIWQGWWLGAFLQTILFVGPIMFLITPAFNQWRKKKSWSNAPSRATKRQIMILSAVLVGGVFLFLYHTFTLVDRIRLNALEKNDHDTLAEAFSVVLQSTQAAFWIMAIVLSALSLLGYQLFNFWTATLSEEKEKAEQANLSKSRFLAAASHDLRQPLQALFLLVEALKGKARRDNWGDHSINLIDRVENMHLALKEILNGLLDVSKFDAGVIPLEKTHFKISDVLNVIRDEFEEVAKSKGLKLSITHSEKIVYSDKQLVTRLLSNLVSNAVKFTEQGKIIVGLRKRGNKISVQVWDSGPGISPANQQEIFEEFTQLNNPARQRNKGIGLGLAIVKRIASLIGTEIELRSKVSTGSCFSFNIPLSNQTELREATRFTATYSQMPSNMDWAKNKRVTYLEDDLSIRENLSSLLRFHEMQVHEFSSVEALQSRLPHLSNPPDLIIADNRLAGEANGIEAIRVMRRHFKTDIPAIIVSGDTSPRQLDEFQRNGMTYLPKPVQPHVLLNVMSQFVK